MEKLRVLEAFSGVGSQRMALRNLGIPYEVVAISEIDKYALKSYEAIHGDCPNLGDISQLNVDDIPDHDLFTYSFPCTDISLAGKQASLEEGSGTRSSLLWECKKIIKNKKPKYLLMENVKNLVGKKHKEHFDKWLEWLGSQGYKNYWKVLNAKGFGIPQNRERVFCISILGEHKQYEFPQPIELKLKLKDILEKNVDEKYYLSEKMIMSFSKHKERHLEKGTGFIWKPKSENDIANCLRANAAICPTDNTLLVKDINKQPSKEVCRIRRLTPIECWRLMGFSDEDFYKAKHSGVSDTQLYKQAGNSIVCKGILEGIFRNLLLNNN